MTDFGHTPYKNVNVGLTEPKIIVNAYYVLMTRGMLGTYLYVCDPALKEYLSRYIPVV